MRSPHCLCQPTTRLKTPLIVWCYFLTQYVNNTRTSHNFKFDGVLGEKASQVTAYGQACGGNCSRDTVRGRLPKGLVSSESRTARQAVSGFC